MGTEVTRLFDTSALVSMVRDDPAASEVAGLLSEGRSITSVLVVAELVDQLERIAGSGERVEGGIIQGLVQGGLGTMALDLDVAQRGGALRAASYNRATCPISMADCIIIASAEAMGATLVSSDADQCRVARSIGVDVHPLPNSAGVRPEG